MPRSSPNGRGVRGFQMTGALLVIVAAKCQQVYNYKRLHHRQISGTRWSDLHIFCLNISHVSITPSVFETALNHLNLSWLRRNFLDEKPNCFSTSRYYFRESIEAFRHYFGKLITIGLPLTYRFVYIWVSDKIAHSDRFYATEKASLHWWFEILRKPEYSWAEEICRQISTFV